MNSLLSFRNHYLELMKQQEKMGEILKNSKSGTQAVQDKYSELDTKLREVNKELDKYHDKVIKDDI